MDVDVSQVLSAKDDLRDAILTRLESLRQACGDDKSMYLEEAYEVISEFTQDLEDSMGYSEEPFSSTLDLFRQRNARVYDPDSSYDEEEDWTDDDDDWNDFEEEDA